jgi:hypothetical protein
MGSSSSLSSCGEDEDEIAAIPRGIGAANSKIIQAKEHNLVIMVLSRVL